MEVLSIAIEVAKTVRLAIAAVKGEADLIISARQLMRSCQLYEDCLQSLHTSLQDKARLASFTARSREDFDKSLAMVVAQVEHDTDLLNSILKETGSIAKTSKAFGAIRNAFISGATGRVQKIKDLESELMSRVQLVTAMLMKDMYKSSQGLDDEIVQEIGDVDGSLFWNGHFGTERQVSFRAFLEAYQSYLSHTFLFRRMPQEKIITLLRHTLLDEAPSSFRDSSLAAKETLLATGVSVKSFATWLHRFGPMKDTLVKASAVSLPDLGSPTPWFHKGCGRDGANRIISGNISKFAQGVSPQHLIVLRYSSDPKYDFVISTMPPTFANVENYPVGNGPKGYKLLGQDCSDEETSPDLLDLIQKQVIDKLFVKATGKACTLPKQPLEQWSKIFQECVAELPANHYLSADELDKASQAIDFGSAADGKEMKSNAGYATLFNANTEAAASSSAYGNDFHTASTAPAPPLGNTSGSEQAVIGKYMTRQGLLLLQQSGHIDKDKVDKALTMLSL